MKLREFCSSFFYLFRPRRTSPLAKSMKKRRQQRRRISGTRCQYELVPDNQQWLMYSAEQSNHDVRLLDSLSFKFQASGGEFRSGLRWWWPPPNPKLLTPAISPIHHGRIRIARRNLTAIRNLVELTMSFWRIECVRWGPLRALYWKKILVVIEGHEDKGIITHTLLSYDEYYILATISY